MRKLIVLCLLCCPPMLAQADTIYRWVDKQGVIHYSNKAPANDKHAKPILKTPSASTGASAPVSGTGSGTVTIAPATSLPPAQPVPPMPPGRSSAEAPSPQADAGQGGVEKTALLQQQLQLAKLQLLAAAKAYEEGKAVRLGSERNYVRYQTRVDALAQQVREARDRVLLLEQNLGTPGNAE